MTPFTIHPDTTVGPVYLTVSNLKRSEKFYTEVLGFRPLLRQDHTLSLTAAGASPLLELKEDRSAPIRPPHTTGLYHFAILVPSRLELARSIRRIADTRYPIQGGTDHRVSEALYLADPDDNGIEIYHDRPRETWIYPNGEIHMESDPLDFDGILSLLESDQTRWDGLASGTRVGHMHLNVADLTDSEEFYHGVLGFEIKVRRSHGALFISAGGYHHHLGLNIWDGAGAPPPPRDALGLRYYSIALPNVGELQKMAGRVEEAGIKVEEMDEGLLLRDPSQNGVLLTHR